MSVLKRIQGKLESVQQDLSAGIKSFRSGAINQKGDPIHQKNQVSYNAGADLLNSYQESWHTMHMDMEASAVEAQNCASSIVATSSFIDKEHQHLTKLHDELVLMPNIIDDVTKLSRVVDEISLLGTEVETSLVQLENLIEELEMTKEKDSHMKQLEAYRVKRNTEAENFAVKCASDHAIKIVDKEKKKQAELKERSQFFQEAFNQDLEFYKIFGQIERPRSSSSENPVELGEITLDNDTTELDNFLDNIDEDAPIAEDGAKLDKLEESDGDDSGIHNVDEVSNISGEVDTPQTDPSQTILIDEKQSTMFAIADTAHADTCTTLTDQNDSEDVTAAKKDTSQIYATEVTENLPTNSENVLSISSNSKEDTNTVETSDVTEVEDQKCETVHEKTENSSGEINIVNYDANDAATDNA